MFRYYDGQQARVGDTAQGANCGTVRVQRLEYEAVLRNVKTGETWEYDTLSDFDLLDRAAPTISDNLLGTDRALDAILSGK